MKYPNNQQEKSSFCNCVLGISAAIIVLYDFYNWIFVHENHVTMVKAQYGVLVYNASYVESFTTIMAKLQGKDLIVFYRTGDEYTTLAYATQCELDISAETMEVSSPDTGRWRTYRKRRLSWGLKNAKLVSRLSEGDLAQAIASSARVRVVFIMPLMLNRLQQ